MREIIKFESLVILLVLLFNDVTDAQSKKKVRKYFIKSVTESITEKINEGETVRMKSFKIYDGNGNIIEETDYHKDGTFKSKTTRKFNIKNDVTEEITTDSDKKKV